MSARIVCSLVAAVALAGPACVMAPTNHFSIGDPVTPIAFNGLSDQRGARIDIEVKNQRSNTWEVVASATTGTTPAVPKGPTGDPPDLYSWSVTTPLADRARAETFCRFGAGCHPLPLPTACEYSISANVRIRTADGKILQTFDDNWSACFNQKRAAGKTFLSAAYECRSVDTPELTIHAVHIC